MKKLNLKQGTKIIIAGLILFAVNFQSCKKEESQGVTPVLPPQSAFVMEFSDFDNANKDVKSLNNYLHSALNVGVWNIVLTVGLVVPVASYVEAVKQEPTYQGDNKWLWSYSFGTQYQANLTGTVKGTEIEWEMRISKTGSYTDFLWYKGTSDISRTYAKWTLYKSQENPTELLSIDWKLNSDGTAQIEYKNIEPAGAENGGYISYGQISGSEFDSFYNIYNKGKDNLTEIEWSKVNKNGHVKDKNKFGDEQWHCWDTSFNDVDCQ